MRIQTFEWLRSLSEPTASFNFWEMLRWLYRLPGSLIMEGLGNIPPVAQILHIQASSATGYASLDARPVNVLSMFVWAALLLWILHTSSEPKAQAKPLKERQTPRLHSKAQVADTRKGKRRLAL